MCGIVGGVAQRNISSILIEGLKRLEYRGYDSAGLAVVNEEKALKRIRSVGKVSLLENKLKDIPLTGETGIAHTRWATHGKPTEDNAHPHTSRETLAVVHNGIIENFEALRTEQRANGYDFYSETDTEVIVHCIHKFYCESKDLLDAVNKTVAKLEGAFALAVINKESPGRMIAVRKGSPLVIGIGIGEHFIASDYMALLPVTQKFIVLDEGDVADVYTESMTIYDASGQEVERQAKVLDMKLEVAERGEYRHFMLKEIYQQPDAINATAHKLVVDDEINPHAFGAEAVDVFTQVENIQIIACGTSYHAGCVAKYWFEAITAIPCQVEIASEFRYRKFVVPKNTLFVTLSQSGETADTLSALRLAKQFDYLSTLTICNVPNSSLIRESELSFRTKAGPEIGVASTKAFTTQLVALFGLMLSIGQCQGKLRTELPEYVSQFNQLAFHTLRALELSEKIQELSDVLAEYHDTLYLGRGQLYPIAMEGALKLKEVSYLHAESYPAGELKHGPLALVDKDVPVIALAQNDELLEKLKSNLQEVHARGGQIILFIEQGADYKELQSFAEIIELPKMPHALAPALFTIPLQLLAYFVAVKKGTDVDQPRNLAKSVTVE